MSRSTSPGRAILSKFSNFTWSLSLRLHEEGNDLVGPRNSWWQFLTRLLNSSLATLFSYYVKSG
jgi:hypothetical protein